MMMILQSVCVCVEIVIVVVVVCVWSVWMWVDKKWIGRRGMGMFICLVWIEKKKKKEDLGNWKARMRERQGSEVVE